MKELLLDTFALRLLSRAHLYQSTPKADFALCRHQQAADGEQLVDTTCQKSSSPMSQGPDVA